MSIADKLDAIFQRPKGERFTEEEKRFIKSVYPKKKFRILYVIYKRESKKKQNIGVVLDQNPNSKRRSLVMNLWDVIADRELTQLEYDETIENIDCNIKRFVVWWYEKIEDVISDDLHNYGVETPEAFVEECRNRGFTGAVQLKLDL